MSEKIAKCQDYFHSFMVFKLFPFCMYICRLFSLKEKFQHFFFLYFVKRIGTNWFNLTNLVLSLIYANLGRGMCGQDFFTHSFWKITFCWKCHFWCFHWKNYKCVVPIGFKNSVCPPLKFRDLTPLVGLMSFTGAWTRT